MSGVKHFHKKEAARILIELRTKTEDERLMDYRRQLLQNDENVDNPELLNETQNRLEQGLWPWPYPNPSLPPFNPNTLPFGYPPCVPNPAPPMSMWFPPSTAACTEPGKYNMQPGLPIFHGMDFQHPFAWPHLAAAHHPGFMDISNGRRRRTKFTNEQLTILEESFTHGSKFPTPAERMHLETRTGLSKEKISVWFQNRRAKEKREKNQEESKTEGSTTDSDDDTEGDGELRICEKKPETENDTKSESPKEKCSRTPEHSSPSFEESPKKSEMFKTDNESIIPPGSSSDTGEHCSDNIRFVPSICVVSDDDASIRVIDMTGKHCLEMNSSEEEPDFQSKKRKYFHAAGQAVSEYPGMSAQSGKGPEYRPFGEA